ncbi:MAG TPA: CYTH domain-containing protein [Rhizobiaceae bacterium]|nr:CYTH domain-containing protein [Rhizobiaceae bacterium]
MAKEVERKFLVKDEAWRKHAEAAIGMRQFYVAGTAGRSVRIRIRDEGTATLTLKFGGHGPERDEFEYAIPVQEAEDMLRFALGHVIEKTRHHVPYKGRLYEIDVFSGSLAGLVIGELETPEHVPPDELPPWLGQEVTDDASYYNASLARHGLPETAA